LIHHKSFALPRDLRGWGSVLACAVAVLALAWAIPVRFFISHGQPLWLDETWTGAIAAQPSFAAVVRQAWLDVNAPLYYGVMHLWAQAFGVSNAALRLPSALFGAAAPLLIVFARGTGLALPLRLTWAALLALWTQGIYLSGEARGYTLLLLLCTASALAYMRLVAAPTLGRAAIWCGLSALAVLTHYHALILAGLQGLAYLAWRRQAALRTWPAALLFLPAFAWLAVHLPRIAEFMRPGVAWYPILNERRLERALAFPLGPPSMLPWLGGVLAVGVVVAAGTLWMIRRGRRARAQDSLAAWATFGLALVGAAAILAMGFVRPSFTDRYLVPFTPALLLGLTLLAGRIGRGTSLLLIPVAVVFAWAAVPFADTQVREGWRWYNWEVASRDLMRGRPERLVFVWDHPASPVLARDQLEMIGGFFFRRAGAPVEVLPLVLDARSNPNPRVAEALRAPRAALIWAYDRGVIGTAARRFAPRLDSLDPSLICRNYGSGSIGVLACDRVGSVKTTAKP